MLVQSETYGPDLNSQFIQQVSKGKGKPKGRANQWCHHLWCTLRAPRFGNLWDYLVLRAGVPLLRLDHLLNAGLAILPADQAGSVPKGQTLCKATPVTSAKVFQGKFNWVQVSWASVLLQGQLAGISVWKRSSSGKANLFKFILFEM